VGREVQVATCSAGAYDTSLVQLQPELGSGESLLWSGQPQRKVIFHASDWAAIPFSFLWGGFFIFWEWGASGHFGSANNSHTAPVFFTLWGIPFILMGQYMIWGRFSYIAWKKGRTHYAVTSRRVLVLYVGSTRKLIDGTLQNLSSISLSTRSDGIGTVEFSPNDAIYNPSMFNNRRRGGIPMDVNLSRLAFIDIVDARGVYQTIQSQRERLHASG
jgi:hypothetical protein